MKSVIISIFLLTIIMINTGLADEFATTDNGKRVILYSNGSWEYYSQSKTDSTAAETFNRPADANKLYKGRFGTYGIWVDSTQWTLLQNKQSPDTEMEFNYINGDCYAMVVFERVEGTADGIKQVSIENMLAIAEDVNIEFEENRVVNGENVICLKVNAVMSSFKLTYLNYYYSGKAGTIQVFTFTGSNLFDEYKQEMTDFLNGFVTLDN